MPSLHLAMQKRIADTRTQLAQNAFAPPPESSSQSTTVRPSPVALYFAGIPRGPVGAFRRLLLADHSLPRWALLAISFTGPDRVEILVHKPLVERLVAVMQLLGYRYMRNHDPAAAHGSDRVESQKYNTAPWAMRECAVRWQRCAISTQGQAAKHWYKSAISAACKKHPDLAAELREIFSQAGKTRTEGRRQERQTTQHESEILLPVTAPGANLGDRNPPAPAELQLIEPAGEDHAQTKHGGDNINNEARDGFEPVRPRRRNRRLSAREQDSPVVVRGRSATHGNHQRDLCPISPMAQSSRPLLYKGQQICKKGIPTSTCQTHQQGNSPTRRHHELCYWRTGKNRLHKLMTQTP